MSAAGHDDAGSLHAIRFELEYWRALLTDARALNDGMLEVSQQLAGISVTLLTLMQAPADTRAEFVLDGMSATTAAMRSLRELATPLDNVINLAGGRLEVLSAAIEGSRHD